MTTILRAGRIPSLIAAILLVLPSSGRGQNVSKLEAVSGKDIDPSTAREVRRAVFSPAPLRTEDFAVEWTGPPPAQLSAELESGSLEWVIAGRLKVPRGILVLRRPPGHAATVAQAGALHAWAADTPSVTIPILLLTGVEHRIRIRFADDRGADLEIRFRPRPANQGLVLMDATCSPFGLHVREGTVPPDSYLYFACGQLRVARRSGISPSVEARAYWQGSGDLVALNGISVPPDGSGTWSVTLPHETSALRLQTRGHEITMAYRIPPRLRALSLGIGLGPYVYHYDSPLKRIDNDLIALATLYGSLTIAPNMRVVYFNAAPVLRPGYFDQGLYLWTEQFRLFDSRMSFNLLLGFHALVFQYAGDTRLVPSLPQGGEVVFTDFLARGFNFAAGAFYYPEINRRSYINAWLRWGTPLLFAEINYLDWKEPVDSATVHTRAIGASLGVHPLRLF